MSAEITASGIQFNDVEEIPQIVNKLRSTFMSGKTRNVEYRKNQLKQLSFLLSDNAEEISKAIEKDLGRARFETIFAEVMGTTNEIIEAIESLDSWVKTDKPWAGVAWAMHGASVRKDPKGTVLVLGAWNYPVSVQIGPMIAAIAAGNTVVMKPSEVSPHSAKIIAELFEKYMDPESYAIVNGGIPQATALLDQRFEHIFYTGNGTVGRIVAEKAAKWLTPTTLELGGKSPVYIDDSADLKIAAHRILWGKSLNCGQTCIAPDYVLISKKNQDKLVEEFKKAAAEFWPESKGGVINSDSYGKIVNKGHWNRLNSMLGGTKGEIVMGETGNEDKKFLPPTIVKNVGPDDSCMQGEIFGPILPIMPVSGIKEAVDYINSKDQPLALYAFSSNQKNTDYLFNNTRSGAACQGDVLLHFAVGVLPFGGTGPSGYSSYHGKYGFDCFSHLRSGINAPSSGIMGKIIELAMAARYPPYTNANLAKFKALIGRSPNYKRPSNPHQVPKSKSSSSILRRLATILALVAIILGARSRGLITAF